MKVIPLRFVFLFLALKAIAIEYFRIAHPSVGYHTLWIIGSGLNETAFFIFYGEVIEEYIRTGGNHNFPGVLLLVVEYN